MRAHPLYLIRFNTYSIVQPKNSDYSESLIGKSKEYFLLLYFSFSLPLEKKEDKTAHCIQITTKFLETRAKIVHKVFTEIYQRKT